MTPRRADSGTNPPTGRYRETQADRNRSDSELKKLASGIRDLRKLRGLTQAQLGLAIGTDQTGIARLESGRHAPSFRTLQAIARVTQTELDLLYRHLEPLQPGLKATNTMTDTRSRPRLFTDRRNFLAGAMGLAGMLGIGGAKRVSAQEATAAATAVENYVWTPPAWEDPLLFEILEQGEGTARVRTRDGEIEIPTAPQRLVALDYEYTYLVPLGIDSGYAGVLAPTTETDSNVVASGDYSEQIESALEGVPTTGTWAEIDIEGVIAADSDLVLGFGFDWEDRDMAYEAISEVAPYVRSVLSSANYPISSLEQFGALFGREEQAASLIEEFNQLVGRAREAIAPHIEGKKVAVLIVSSMDSVIASPSYFTYEDGLSEGKKVLNTNSSVAHFRDLEMTPSSFIEALADDDDRSRQYYTLSFEQIGLLDADYIFINIPDDLLDEFLNHPVVQSTPAGVAGNVLKNQSGARGYGFGARLEEIRSIVMAITGKTFE